MKTFIGIMAVFVLLFVVILVSKHTASQRSLSEHTIESINADTAKGGQLIDVRTPEEFSAGHIVGAINLSLQSIQSGYMPSSAKDMPLYVYCRSGSRSSQAAALLKKAGYINIIDLGAMTNVEKIGGKISQ